MTPRLTLSDRFRLVAFRSYWGVCAARDRVARGVSRLLAGESGQTSSEYLTMAGILAAIILITFGGIFVPQMRQAISTFVSNAKSWVSSTRVH